MRNVPGISCVLLFALVAATAPAQESRGSISGTVKDPQGAVIAGATVIATNIETNIPVRSTTNQTGYFEMNLLIGGSYTVSAEAPGFHKAIHSGLELQVAGRLNVEFNLQLGAVAESIEVTAASPLLDTTTASGGRVIDSRQMSQLPFTDMNPFALATLAPGVQWTGQPEWRRPFDVGGTSSFNTMGGVGQNEYTVDGAPVTGTDRRVGFVPSPEAIEEFRLEATNFDASYGHTSGATINVMTKAGTNTYHGVLFDQHWQQRWNATPHFVRLAFEDAVRAGKKKPTDQKQSSGRSNQFGATLGGPVRIPRLYNGKDRFFFMFAYDGIYQNKVETTDRINLSVPKMAWRQGDFSDLLAVDPQRYTVYDPRSATLQNGRVIRTPFPGNKGVPVLNPMYKYYEPIYPKPNDVAGVVNAEGVNNYYGAGMPQNDMYNSIVNRVDYNVSQNHRVFARWFWSRRNANSYDWTYESVPGLHSNMTLSTARFNKGGGLDYTWTANATNILNLSANASRYSQGGVNTQIPSYKPSHVGLPAYVDQEAGEYTMLPQVAIGGVQTVGQGAGGGGGYPAIGQRGATGEFRAQMTSVRGNHSMRYGYQERRYWYTSLFPGTTSGVFSFTNTYTRQADNTSTAGTTGLSWAAFMMGLPSSISIARNDSALYSTRFRSLYLQDEWRLSSRLRINLGLRYEREAGSTERFDRGIGGGFDFNYRPPFADAAEAAYAKTPLAELPAAQFKVLGGVQYLGKPNRNYTDGTQHLMPKASLVYQLTGKTVLRGGYGWYYDTYNANNDRPSQDGYLRQTNTTLTNDQGLTFCCGLGAVGNLSATNNPMLNPFPLRADGTRFDSAYGNSLGAVIRQGRGWTITPRDYNPAAQQRWRIAVQRQLSRDSVIEVSYNGARSRIPVLQTISYIPQQYWVGGNVRNATAETNMNTNVPNPFNIANFPALQASDPKLYAYLSTVSFFTGTTVRKSVLLRSYPNMNGLTGIRPGSDFNDVRGTNKYHDLQVQFEKRFSHGFQSTVLYTRAYDQVKDYYANEFEDELSWRTGADVRPHRFVWTNIFELPFGKGRALLKSHPLGYVVGGWNVSWIYQYQNGPATGWSNRFFYGDMSRIGDLFAQDKIHSADIHMWFDPNIAYRGTGAVPSDFQGFEGRGSAQPASFQLRTFPTRLSELREDGIRNWDVKIARKIKVHERLATSFSVDLLNATNHTNFAGPDTDPTSTSFGRVRTQRGLSRMIQFNLRIEF